MSQRVVGKIITRNSGILLLDKWLINPGMCMAANVYRPRPRTRPQVFFKSTNKEDLGQTAILLPDGLDMQELPEIVRKVKDSGMVTLHNLTTTKPRQQEFPEPEYVHKKTYAESENITEYNAIMSGLNRCFSVKGVLHLLASIPEEEKTPKVALETLKKIIELENIKPIRNRHVKIAEEVPLPNYFSRTATMNELVDTITCSSDVQLVLEGLKVISCDISGGENCMYREKLCEEVVTRATDNKFTVPQICEIANIFSSLNTVKTDAIDKLWVGIVDKDEEITESNINELFRILPMFEQSRHMLLKILEKRILNVWWRLSGRTIADALAVLFEVKSSPHRVMVIFSRWLNGNIDVATEDDVIRIVRGFSALEYVDKGIECALERFVTTKGLTIKNPGVLAAILDYCAQFRIRSCHIMEGCAEYFIEHGASLPPNHVKSFFVPFGLLDFSPPNGIKFWKVLEKVMDRRFTQFRPEDALDLLLSCVYLEKHPFNFVKKMFNPYFLDRLHSTTDQNTLQLMRTKLKLFDTAMTLECPDYRGPLLPKDHSSKSLWQDGRVKRMVNNILEPLTRIAGGADMLTTSVVLGQLPTMGLYVVDVLFHPRGTGTSMLQFKIRQEPNVCVAILIHIPEHYCSEGKYLLGPQVMRKRHFRKLGMKVVDLEYDKLAKLHVHPQTLESYLVQKVRGAERAFIHK